MVEDGKAGILGSNRMIYVAEDLAGHIKVGFSVQPTRRVHQYRAPSGKRPKLWVAKPGSRKDESQLHKRLRPWRLADEREWYRRGRPIQ